MLKGILEKILAWFTPSQETVEASIHTSMWAEGYSDLEIQMAIEDYRRTVNQDQD